MIGVWSIRGLLAVGLWAVAANGHVWAAGNRYAEHSDAELSALAADWEDLSEEQRRALLTETTARMSERTGRDAEPVIQIQAQRRFGRVIRQPDGSLVRIETRQRVIQYRTMPDQVDSDRAYGVGFEKRHGAEEPAPQPAPAPREEARADAPPVLRVHGSPP